MNLIELKTERKIIHVDMDAFYASVEIKDHPELKGKPVIVGGNPNSRSVVCAASYEARTYGVRSAMGTAKAYKLCPHGVFLAPRIDRYKQVSVQIHEIFQKYTGLIEPLSLDEAWLDVSHHPSATIVAKKILAAIQEETGLTASAGISTNKMLAKIATEVNKPNGFFVIPPNQGQAFLAKLSLGKIPGVGKVTLANLQKEGYYLCRDLLDCSKSFLLQRYGKMGAGLYDAIRGIDNRPVQNTRERKSIGVEWTFEKDLAYGPELLQSLENLLLKLDLRLEQKGWQEKARSLQLKVKYTDFQQCTRMLSKQEAWKNTERLPALAEKLQALLQKEKRLVRLIGVTASHLVGEISLEKAENQQLSLFDFALESVE